ncbi:hypothetical protein BC936DRAFT_137652 [Jimgerdemannia flammicorona]|uniref:Uncharacterized protein n=1 Tax=Jimgerdemannia flammicorona TaxID=994334 RepID=A0A433DJ88_9FUNG|nr:hypothetical protein BC936DRAFT_137652 [Jimgerdemannia flammicorona]
MDQIFESLDGDTIRLLLAELSENDAIHWWFAYGMEENPDLEDFLQAFGEPIDQEDDIHVLAVFCVNMDFDPSDVGLGIQPPHTDIAVPTDLHNFLDNLEGEAVHESDITSPSPSDLPDGIPASDFEIGRDLPDDIPEHDRDLPDGIPASDFEIGRDLPDDIPEHDRDLPAVSDPELENRGGVGDEQIIEPRDTMDPIPVAEASWMGHIRAGLVHVVSAAWRGVLDTVRCIPCIDGAQD